MSGVRNAYSQDISVFTRAYKLLFNELDQLDMLHVLYPLQVSLDSLATSDIDRIIDKLFIGCPQQANRLLVIMEQIAVSEKGPIKQAPKVMTIEGEEGLISVEPESREPVDRCYALSPNRNELVGVSKAYLDWLDLKQLPNGDLATTYSDGTLCIAAKNKHDDQFRVKQTFKPSVSVANSVCLFDRASTGDIVTLAGENKIQVWKNEEGVYFPKTAYNIELPVPGSNYIEKICLSGDGKSLGIVSKWGHIVILCENHHRQFKVKAYEWFEPVDHIKKTFQAFGKSDFIFISRNTKPMYLERNSVTSEYSEKKITNYLDRIGNIERVDLSKIDETSLVMRVAKKNKEDFFVVCQHQLNRWRVGAVFSANRLVNDSVDDKVEFVGFGRANLLAYSKNGLQQFIKNPGSLTYSHGYFLPGSYKRVEVLSNGDWLLFEKRQTHDGSSYHISEVIFPSITDAASRVDHLPQLQVPRIQFPTDKYKRTSYLYPLGFNIFIMVIGFAVLGLWLIESLFPLFEAAYLDILAAFGAGVMCAPFCLIPYINLRRAIDNLLVGRKHNKSIVAITSIIAGIVIGAALGYAYPAYFIGTGWVLDSSITKMCLCMVAGDVFSRLTNKINSTTGLMMGALFGCFFLSTSQMLGLQGLQLFNLPVTLAHQVILSMAIYGSIAASLISKYGMQIYYKIRYGNSNADGEGVLHNPQELEKLYQQQADLFKVTPSDIERLYIFLIKLLRDLKDDKYLISHIIFYFSVYETTNRNIYKDEWGLRQTRNSLKDIIHQLITAKKEEDVNNFKNIVRVSSAAVNFSGGTQLELQKWLASKSHANVYSNNVFRILSHQMNFLQASKGRCRANCKESLPSEKIDQFERVSRPFL